jgi:hypothetical protein
MMDVFPTVPFPKTTILYWRFSGSLSLSDYATFFLSVDISLKFSNLNQVSRLMEKESIDHFHQMKKLSNNFVSTAISSVVTSLQSIDHAEGDGHKGFYRK